MTQSERRYTAGEVLQMVKSIADALEAGKDKSPEPKSYTLAKFVDRLFSKLAKLEQTSGGGAVTEQSVAQIKDRQHTDVRPVTSPPPDSIAVGAGYVRLAAGTKLLATDECQRSDGQWVSTWEAGELAREGFIYRRKLPVKGEESEYESPVSWDELSRLKTLAGLAVELAGAAKAGIAIVRGSVGRSEIAYVDGALCDPCLPIIARIEAAAKETK